MGGSEVDETYVITDGEIDALEKEQAAQRKKAEIYVRETALIWIQSNKGDVFPATFKTFIFDQIKGNIISTVVDSLDEGKFDVLSAIKRIESAPFFRGYAAKALDIGQIHRGEFVTYGYHFLKLLARMLTIYNGTQSYPLLIDDKINELKKVACACYEINEGATTGLMEIGVDSNGEEKLRHLIRTFDKARGEYDLPNSSPQSTPPPVSSPVIQDPQVELTPPAVTSESGTNKNSKSMLPIIPPKEDTYVAGELMPTGRFSYRSQLVPIASLERPSGKKNRKKTIALAIGGTAAAVATIIAFLFNDDTSNPPDKPQPAFLPDVIPTAATSTFQNLVPTAVPKVSSSVVQQVNTVLSPTSNAPSIQTAKPLSSVKIAAPSNTSVKQGSARPLPPKSKPSEEDPRLGY